MKEIEMSTSTLAPRDRGDKPLFRNQPKKRPSRAKKALIFALISIIICLLTYTPFTPSSNHFYHKTTISKPHRFKESTIKLPYSFQNLKHQIFHQKLLNGVEWIHINDPSTEQCAVGIGVSSGSFDESFGKFRPGIAHFLEHTFFLVETVEERNLFSYWNAYTANQKTNFMYSCKKDSFLETFSKKWDELTLFKSTKEVLGEVFAVNNE